MGKMLTHNEARTIAEETTEKMQEMTKTEDRLVKFTNQGFVALAKCHGWVPPTLNEVCSEVKPTMLKP